MATEDPKAELTKFSDWIGLDRPALDEHVPTHPAAIEVRTQKDLVSYPEGKSAILANLYFSQNARQQLAELFADELTDPGTRGYGKLRFRVYSDQNRALPVVRKRLSRFLRRFGSVPKFNQKQTD